MTTIAAPWVRRRRTRAAAPRFVDLLYSEWVKLMSLPAMWLMLLAIFVVGAGGTIFLGVTLESSGAPSTFDPRITMGELTTATVALGQIIAGILGVMCIGAEYSSGTIQPSLLAVPNRIGALFAKAVVLLSTTTVAALAAVFVGWAATYASYDAFGLAVSLDMPGVLIALVGAAAYVGLCSVFGLGLGAIVRSTTVGAIIVFLVTMLGPILAIYLGMNVIGQLVRMSFIGLAGDAMSRLTEPNAPFIHLMSGYMSPQAAWMIVAGWAALALVGGAIVLQKRDA